MTITPELIAFILAAKRAAYAGGGQHAAGCRPGSIDLPYREGDYSYLDSYLGGYAFIGEEAVWLRGEAVWGLNYYGTMLVPEIPAGFGQFLKAALLRVPAEAPYRGPAVFQQGGFSYTCAWTGDPALFEGRETIQMDGQPIYTLNFHGGALVT